MNAYWMNELVHEGVVCPVWLAWVLGGMVVALIVGTIVTFILVNR